MELLPVAVLKRLSEIVASVQKQAPAARMIGKFAVRQATSEVERRISDLTQTQSNNSEKPKE